MSLLGQPFQKWVKDQVDLRQEALGQTTNITSQNLQWYNTKTPWCRLVSAVNLQGSDGDDKTKGYMINKLKKIGLGNLDLVGSRLARNFILQGGSVSRKKEVQATNDDGTLKEGIVVPEDNFTGLSYGILGNTANRTLFNSAYGWGGIEDDGTGNTRGFVPMPGITDASVTYYGNGAYAKTIINIKCYSRNQMALVDALYLHPGFTILELYSFLDKLVIWFN